jgi:hypothetical protein
MPPEDLNKRAVDSLLKAFAQANWNEPAARAPATACFAAWLATQPEETVVACRSDSTILDNVSACFAQAFMVGWKARHNYQTTLETVRKN